MFSTIIDEFSVFVTRKSELMPDHSLMVVNYMYETICRLLAHNYLVLMVNFNVFAKM